MISLIGSALSWANELVDVPPILVEGNGDPDKGLYTIMLDRATQPKTESTESSGLGPSFMVS